MSRFVAALLCLTFIISLVSSYTVISGGFKWAENLRYFPRTNQLIVSDAYIGQLYTFDSNFQKKPKFSQLKKAILGVAVNHSNGTVYIVARDQNMSGSLILALSERDLSIGGNGTVLASLPDVGNGLDLWERGNKLYATTEGNFMPSAGKVYEIDIATGAVSIFRDHLYASDGAFIDQERDILYVSQVIGSQMFAFDLKTRKELFSWKPKDVSMIDDFCLTLDGKYLIAADFWLGNVVALEIPREGVTNPRTEILAKDVQNPTSVRTAFGDKRGLFVTEGGGVLPYIQHERRLLFVETTYQCRL